MCLNWQWDKVQPWYSSEDMLLPAWNHYLFRLERIWFLLCIRLSTLAWYVLEVSFSLLHRTCRSGLFWSTLTDLLPDLPGDKWNITHAPNTQGWLSVNLTASRLLRTLPCVVAKWKSQRSCQRCFLSFPSWNSTLASVCHAASSNIRQTVDPTSVGAATLLLSSLFLIITPAGSSYKMLLHEPYWLPSSCLLCVLKIYHCIQKTPPCVA